MARGLFPRIGAVALVGSVAFFLFLRKRQNDAKIEATPVPVNIPDSSARKWSITSSEEQDASNLRLDQTRADTVWRETIVLPPERPAASQILTFLGLALFFAILAQGLIALLPPQLQLPRIIIKATQPMWPNASSVVVAVLLFVVAILCFGAATRSVRKLSEPRLTVDLPSPHSWSKWSLGAIAISVTIEAWLLDRLARTPYDPAYPRWFVLSMVLVLVGFFVSQPRKFSPRVSRRLTLGAGVESCYVGVFLGGFVWLCWSDLRDWYFSSIGDEYAFYGAAKQIADGKLVWNLFSQSGVYGNEPTLSSYVQGTLMRFFGTDVVGWKLASVVEVAVALLGFYLLARHLFGIRVAILTLGMLATSDYLLAFAHTGYNNLEPLLYSAFSFLFFSIGVRRRSTFWLVVAGICAGLGWYTYYTSRTAIVILALAIVLMVRRRNWLGVGSAVGCGFILMLLPMVAVNKTALLSSMFEQTGAESAEPAANRLLLPLWNAGRTLLAFNYNVHTGPYTYGSLADPTTALFFILGCGFLLFTLKDIRSRFLLTWYGVGALACGVVSKYDFVSISRLNFLVPVVCLIAALAVDRAIQVGLAAVWKVDPWHLGKGSPSIKSRTTMAFVLPVMAVLALVTYGNLERWFVVTPAKLPSTPEAIAMGVLEQQRCLDSPQAPLLIGPNVGGSLIPAVIATEGRLPVPDFSFYNQPTTWIGSADARCVIFRTPMDPQARRLIAETTARWPDLQPVDVYDRAHVFHIAVFYPSDSAVRSPGPPSPLVESPSRLVETLPSSRLGPNVPGTPRAVAVTGNGTVYIVDSGAKRIFEYDSRANFLRSFGGPGTGDGQFQEPVAAVVNPQDELVVLDDQTGWIQRFSPAGAFLGKFGGPSSQLGHPRGLANLPGGGYLVASTDTGELIQFSQDGRVLQRVLLWNPLAKQPIRPVGIAVDPHGVVYVTDAANKLLSAYDVNYRSTANVRLSAFDVSAGSDVAVAPDFTLYVSDPVNHRVIHTGLEGDVNVVMTDQLGTPGQFNRPLGLAIDPSGRVYVADAGSRRVVVFGR